MVPLRFLKGWNGFDPDAEVEFPHPGLAEELVRQGIAEVRTEETTEGGTRARTSRRKAKQKD